MPQAIVDPGELRRFAQSLKRFTAELHSGPAALHGQLLSLGDTWRDQEHVKFTQEFEETMLVVQHFDTLCERAHTGDRAALGQILRQYGPILYRSVLLPRDGSGTRTSRPGITPTSSNGSGTISARTCRRRHGAA